MAGVSIETALCEADPALTCVDASWDSSRQTVRVSSLPTDSAVFVIILIDQSKPSEEWQEKRGGVSYIQRDSVGSSSSSMIPESPSVSQTSSFSVRSTVGQRSQPASVVLSVCTCAYVCMGLIPQ